MAGSAPCLSRAHFTTCCSSVCNGSLLKQHLMCRCAHPFSTRIKLHAFDAGVIMMTFHCNCACQRGAELNSEDSMDFKRLTAALRLSLLCHKFLSLVYPLFRGVGIPVPALVGLVVLFTHNKFVPFQQQAGWWCAWTCQLQLWLCTGRTLFRNGVGVSVCSCLQLVVQWLITNVGAMAASSAAPTCHATSCVIAVLLLLVNWSPHLK
jgi:hypothetical protein